MNRPVIKIKKKISDKIFEIISIVSTLGTLLLLIIYWNNLADIVPIHYRIDAKPDLYGSKTNLILLPVISIVTYLGLTILGRFPHFFNYPVNITEINAIKIYSIGFRLVLIMKMLACAILFYIMFSQTIRKGVLHEWIVIGLIVVITVIPVFYIVKMFKHQNDR